MRLQHNIPSINTNRSISFTQTKLNKSLEKLSSGYKINRACDDAAGLAISEKMRGQIRGLNMAGKNIQDGISLIQTAEGAMNEIHAMLQRVRELTVQSANDTNTDEDRDKIAEEVNAIFEEIDSITDRTEFNGMKLLRGGGTIDPRGPGGGGGSTRGTMLTGDDLTTAQTDFTKRLVQSTLENAENMVANDYGLTVDGKTMTISYITDSPGGMVARVWTSSNPRMEFDNADYFTTGDLWIDEDRIVAHEMVHAVMAASGINMRSMPDWFIEGSAEFLAGAKERLDQSVRMLGVDKVAKMIDSKSHGSHFYSAGYAATIFLDQKIRQGGGTEGLKDLLSYMQTNKTATFDEAMRATVSINGVTGNYGTADLIPDFKANGASLINNVVSNAGVGAISEITGLENGEVKFGANKTDESIVSDGPATVNTTGFNYIFESSTYYDPAMMTTTFATQIAYTTFSTISDAGELMLQIGANSGQTLSVIMPTITADALGLADVDVKILPDYSLGLLDNAINAISKERSKLGAIQNRLEHSYENVMNTAENLSAAESRIRDTDMAKEMMNFTKQNILIQASQSMLGQANQQPQGIIQLLS